MAFEGEAALCLFITVLVLLEHLFGLLGSELIGEIIAGLVVGPALLDVVPYVDSFRLLGKMGIMLLVTESGFSVDIRTVKKVGVRAFLAAISGVIFPVLMSLVLYWVVFEQSWKEALAIGAAIAPTSLGFSAKLLEETGRLQSTFGQMVCAAAVMDDVISLALLAEVKALSGTGSGDSDEAGDGVSDNSASASSSTSTWALTKPVVASLGSIFVGVLLTHLLPPYIARVNAYFCPPKRGPFQFVSVIGLAVLFGYLCALVGSSDLMGCFFAGLLFSELNHDQVNTRDRGSLGTHGQSGVSLCSPVRVEGKQLQRQEEGEDDTIDVHPDRKCGSDKSDRSCNDSDISIDLSGDLHERGSSKSNDDDTNGNVSGDDNENKFSEGRLKQRATTRSRSRQYNAPGNSNHGDGNDDHELDGGSVRDDLEVQPVGIAIPLSQMWTVHVFPVQSWLTKLFFASTIAFGIPKLYKSGGLFEAQAIWRGLLLTCCSIIGKLSTGFFAVPSLTMVTFMQMGWAMEGRGEFSFLIADQASEEGILTDSDYSAVVWALLLTCLVSPFVFRYVLQLDSESCDGRTADGDKNTFDDFSNGDRRDVNQRPGSSSAPCVNHVEMKRGQRHAIATGKAGVDGDGDTFEADLARSGIKITLE